MRARKKSLSETSWALGIYKRYGITKEQYDVLYDSQEGRCYICRRATGKARRLSVDHDHDTGFVRGLLCRGCNTIVGRFRDDPEVFARGRDYLQHPPAFDTIGKVKPDAGEQE